MEYKSFRCCQEKVKNESICYLVNRKNNIPDFFIVGAPKSGTTALDYHLNLHPEVFMAKKELHFFGSDIGIIQEDMNKEEYLSFFNNSKENQLKGESSVWYLFSKNAAKEIKDFNPNAKIIVLLRNPIDSLHSQYIYNGIETNQDFDSAFNADTERLQNNIEFPCNYFKNRPPYLKSVQYYTQLKRYFEIFEKENILILLHEDLSNNFLETYNKVLEFLRVEDKSFTPEIKDINSRKKVKNIKVHQLSKSPPNLLKKIFRVIIPVKSARHAIMQNIDDVNIKTQKKEPISNETKQKIIEVTLPEIKKLEQLIHRDLSAWMH